MADLRIVSLWVRTSWRGISQDSATALVSSGSIVTMVGSNESSSSLLSEIEKCGATPTPGAISFVRLQSRLCLVVTCVSLCQ